jgi:hypothetical protein
MSTPRQPSSVAWRVSATVSGSAAQPVPGMRRVGSIPATTSASSAVLRSATDIEFASDVVPNTASPSAPSSSSWRQTATKRSVSTDRSGAKGVTAGTKRRGVWVMVRFRSAPAAPRW